MWLWIHSHRRRQNLLFFGVTVGETVLAAAKSVVSVAQKKCVELSVLEFVMSMTVLCKHRFASINPLFAVF